MEQTIRQAITTTQLAADGFTPAQIARLETLRERYPVIELALSRQEMDRLLFLKWRRTTGRLED
jgi:hypothetical protein